MNTRELTFRKDLISRMGGRWVVSIHVENHLNPGIPDLSYVMVAPGHETGWLELKVSSRKNMSYSVESSQHQWMIKHADRVPAQFLIKVGYGADPEYYLVDGNKHNQLAAIKTEEELKRLAIAIFTDADLIPRLTCLLSVFTTRSRQHGH